MTATSKRAVGGQRVPGRGASAGMGIAAVKPLTKDSASPTLSRPAGLKWKFRCCADVTHMCLRHSLTVLTAVSSAGC